MPAPKRPNTAAATAAVRARGDRTAADRLTDHGWLALSPEVAATPELARERFEAWLRQHR